VTLEVPPYPTYDAQTQDDMAARIREMGGVLTLVTHAVHPHQVRDLTQLTSLMRDGRALAGWVELDAVRATRPKSPPAKTGTTYVLHYSPDHLSVGPLLAHTTDQMTVEQAQQWARESLGAQGEVEYLLDWEATRPGNPAAGWYTMNAISADQYFLRPYPDGWRLTQALSRADGSLAETDNEARAWANGVIKHKTKLTGLTWQGGPTPDGVVTLYAEG
jgi:hypothetical protein